ncbi:zinc-binding dehydrogenase, partial [Streptomyces sp. NPDC059445]|uniref:zinc-binding dehydrogenase n=1 Tax=Streptomyces sp. NPDC059445 TaxID=3346832 RepID=UPI0036CA9731
PRFGPVAMVGLGGVLTESRGAGGGTPGPRCAPPPPGDEGVARVRDLTGGEGTRKVLECVGLKDALAQSFGVVRDGGTISRVGAPQYPEVPFGFGDFLRNITLTGGVAPARAYIEELMPHILDGSIRPGRVFDRTVDLENIADGYRAMNEREALKVLVTP